MNTETWGQQAEDLGNIVRESNPAAATSLYRAAALLREGESDPLTGREREVLHHLAHGLTNRQIAAELHCKENTVRTHVFNIARKLGLSRRAEMVRWAMLRGLG